MSPNEESFFFDQSTPASTPKIHPTPVSNSIPAPKPNPLSIPDPDRKNHAEKSSDPPLFPTDAPTKPSSNSPHMKNFQTDQERERAEQVDIFEDCFSDSTILNNFPCANILYATAPLVYTSKANKYPFNLTLLYPPKLPTAHCLF